MSKQKSRFGKYLIWTMNRLALLLFDILVINLSYYLALVIRFFVNWEFRPIAVSKYLPAFWTFAPYYTAVCVVVFIAFKLYNNRWKHAGLYDLNVLLLSNAVTAVIHVVGTLAFVCRMPITYYLIGAVLQFCMIAGGRFAYRAYVMERNRIRRRGSATLNVMIVGTGETARILRRQIEADSTNVAKPMCIFSYYDEPAGRMENGLPVLSGMERLAEHFAKYRIKCVILADSLMSADIRKQIRAVCQNNGIEVQDFSGYLTGEGYAVTLRKLMEHVYGPVEIKLDGMVADFQNGEQALMAYPEQYDVKRIYVNGDKLSVDIAKKSVILNDTNEEWIRDTENESGEEISFF